MKMAHYLEFINPVIQDEKENLTVRLGNGWFEKARMGDLLLTVIPEEYDVLHICLVTWVSTILFKDIPESMLEYGHDPACRTMDGLRKAMKLAYGEKFQEDSQVTLLFFKKLADVVV